MKSAVWTYLFGMIFVLSACTGQKPADLKNVSPTLSPVSAACSHIKLVGKVLAKQNLLDIFECSGWAKKYPTLNSMISSLNEASFNQVLTVMSEPMLNDPHKQKILFNHLTRAEGLGQMDSLARLIEKSLSNYKVLTQINTILDSQAIDDTERTSMMKILSNENSVNVLNLKSIKAFATAFELQKTNLNLLVGKDPEFKSRVVTLMDDLSDNMDTKHWGYVSKLIHGNGYPLKAWGIGGLQGDLSILLNVVKTPNFLNDIRFLNKSLVVPITCQNAAHVNDFAVNVGQELKYKIDSLKNDTYEVFEMSLLDGLTKYLAFQELCGEKERPQGLRAFFNVSNYAFKIIPSGHDFRFLKSMHQIFGEDRYQLLRFLTTRTFTQLRELLITLGQDGNDESFIRSLNHVMAEVPNKDYKVISDWVADLSTSNGNQTRSWYKAWSHVWLKMTSKEKTEFVEFLGILTDKDVVASDAMDIVINLFESFPDLSPVLSSELERPEFQNNLRYLLLNFGHPDVQQDLSGFLSNKGLFEFLKIVVLNSSKDFKQERRTEETTSTDNEPLYVTEPSLERTNNLTRECYYSLSETYRKNSSYYAIVNNLPDTCLNILGQTGFMGQIYLWMNSAQKFFVNEYKIDDFHAGTGIWGPPMLHFLYTKTIFADRVLVSVDGKKGILANVDAVHRSVTSPFVLEAFHLFSKLYVSTSELIPFEPRLENYFSRTSDADHNQHTSNMFTLMETVLARYYVNAKPYDCQDISSQQGIDPCLTADQTKDQSLELLRLLKRRNEDDQSLVKELIRWMHPKGGIPLPFNRDPIYYHVTTMDEIIRFLYDLSTPNKLQEFDYNDGETVKTIKGTVLDRLEIVVRDIGFKNNYYGAHFMNEIAAAVNYRIEINAKHLLLVWFDRASGLLRRIGALPAESAWKLKNLRNTYWSLAELDDEYKQLDGSVRTYGRFMQSMLAAVTRSSRKPTQTFNPYRIPREATVEGHNGMFIVKGLNMSGMRQLALFIRSRVKDLSFLDTPEFKKINANIISRFPLKPLQANVQRIMESYLDNDRNQLNLILNDLIDFLRKLSPEEQKALEEIVLKSMLILSDNKISTDTLLKFSDGVELMIKNWPEIRQVLLNLDDAKSFLGLINDGLNAALENCDATNDVLTTMVTSEVMNLSELETLIKNPDFRQQATQMLNHMSKYDRSPSELNWIPTLKAMMANSGTQWEPLVTWFATSLNRKPQDKLTVSVLLSVIGQKNDGKYVLKSIMDELFINHRPELNHFLRETFPSLDLKN